MTSRTTKAVSLAGALSLVANPLADLGNVAKRTFDEFFGSGKPTIERTVTTNDYGVSLAYAEDSKRYAEDSKSLDRKIDTTTYWTPDKLRQVINEPKLSFIYWRIDDGDEETRRGERFFKDFLRDYGQRFDRVIVIEGLRHGERQYRNLKEVLNEFNKSEQSSTHKSPIYSIVGFGGEVRIRGPPKEPYQERYDKIYKPGIDQHLPEFEAKKRESFLGTK